MKIYLSILVFVGLLINATAATSSVRAVDTNLFTGSITVSNLTTLTIPMADSSTKKLVDSPLSVSSGTNASLPGNLSLHDLNVTNDTTIGGSLNLSGVAAANIALNAGGTISNGGGDFALTNDLPVHFQSNVVVNSTITDSTGSVGETGQVLKSGGSGAGTTWSSPGGYTISMGWSSTSPSQGATLYGAHQSVSLSATVDRYKYIVARPGTLRGYTVNVYGAAGTVGQPFTTSIIVNGGSALGEDAFDWVNFPVERSGQANTLSTALSVGDTIQIKVVAPNPLTTPPTGTVGLVQVNIEEI